MKIFLAILIAIAPIYIFYKIVDKLIEHQIDVLYNTTYVVTF